MTEKLYNQDAYLFEFYAKVLSSTKTKNGYEIILDKTAFFPESAGQSCDEGFINNARITRASIKEDLIIHLSDTPLEAGEEVVGKIDSEKRLRNMAHHSAEHIISGIIKEKFGFENVGFNLSEKQVTLDTSGALSDEDIETIEREANKIVRENRRIHAFYPSPQQAEILDYRSKKEISENLRLVMIDGVDLCACSAPHVRTTGEIGCIKITDRQSYKGGTRLHMQCSDDAIKDYQFKQNELLKIARFFSKKPFEAYDAVIKQADDLKKLQATVDMLTKERSKSHFEKEKGKERVVVFDNFLSKDDKIELSNLLMGSGTKLSAVLSGSDSEGYSGVVATEGFDSKLLLEAMKKELSAKGGGKGNMLHLSMAASLEKINNFFLNIT